MKPSLVVLGPLLACVSCIAADLSGTWTGQLPPRPNAQGQTTATHGPDIVFQFTQSGASLTGKQYGDYRSAPILEGRIDGSEVRFRVAVSEQAGNQTNKTYYVYTGIFEGEEVKLKRERQSSVNVGNGEIAPGRGGAPQAFILKRLQ